jgi:hypothetical protein
MASPSIRENVGYPVSRTVDQHSMVDTKTATRVLGLRNHHTLEVWRAAGTHPELRFFKIGRAVRYRIADLEAFLTANAVGKGVGTASAWRRTVGNGADRC